MNDDQPPSGNPWIKSLMVWGGIFLALLLVVSMFGPKTDAALEWAATCEWGERVTQGDAGLTYRPHAPRAVRLRVLARAIATLGHEGTPRGAEIARLHDALSAGGVATLGGVRGEAKDDGWRFTPAPPRRTRAAD